MRVSGGGMPQRATVPVRTARGSGLLWRAGGGLCSLGTWISWTGRRDGARGRAVRLGRLWRSCDVRRLAGRGRFGGSAVAVRLRGVRPALGLDHVVRANGVAEGRARDPATRSVREADARWMLVCCDGEAGSHGARQTRTRTVPSRLSFGGTQTESVPRLPFPGRGPGAGGEGQRPVGADLPGCAPTGLGAARGCGPRAGELGLRVDSAWSCLVRLARSRRRGYSHTFRARTANGDCGTYVPPPG
ncbi:hypothetical protein SAMN05421854_11344 [Amycolatopsis rubida]|uniref:Uncharacterized protein n=1 Tax=Amycolatopsis rubida TaxID=112413 RepID=A0A1I5YUN0_9PSEU|nr:hypothetical protein SAMN05421854_11344 [Amycolatopsis rubida]